MDDYGKEASPKIELRDKIVEKAGEFFMAYGIKSITMDEIAASLGISKRTLYEVFEDKETLLKECILRNHKAMNDFLEDVFAKSTNVLEVILMCYKYSIERFHNTNKRFFEDIKKYPKVHEMMKNYRDRDSDSTIAFFKMGVEQGIIRDDVNFAIVNLLVREQIDMLMNTDICKEYSFLEVYESIMFTYIRGISTEKGARVLEDFIVEYRQSKGIQQPAESTKVKNQD
ncbi:MULTISPECIES: TetR/AcrR family transcriptional regulator [Bacteroides]|uniref:TetR/AcrR family transcriptional regulator n=1 Tax=Bacteroides TaxID=816 RepID=UPI0005A8CE6C|nr:TetR/AcrR family transcriptional regulator [Bacteroides neonati]